MKQKIILVGSGWATKGFLDRIDHSKYDIFVVSKNKKFVYQPFLAESLVNDKIETSFELQKKYPFITFQENEVYDVDFESQKIILTKNEENNYDYLILAHGAMINDFNIPGLKDHAYILQDQYQAKVIYQVLKQIKPNASIAIIGCGLTGTEIIGHLIDQHKYDIHAIDGLYRPLSAFSQQSSNYIIDFWTDKYINMYFGQIVKNIDKNYVYTHDQCKIKYDLAIWCGGIKINPLSEKINSNLKIHNKFGIPVNKNLEIVQAKNAFACGDCAHSGYSPNAQVSYQQGKYLAKQFNHKWKLKKKPFHFYNKGQVCYIGNKKSIYEKNDLRIDGSLGYIMMKCVKFYIKYL